MAELDFILQAVTTENHAKALQDLLALPGATEVLVSVAFVKEPGLEAIEDAIKPFARRARFFIGIRNDITSIQAVKHLLEMKVKLYAVDTGSRGVIFHPKLYLAASAIQAKVIIGSANLTFGGLHNNIEASTCLNLNLSNAADKNYKVKVVHSFEEMLKKHPEHVFLIRDEKHADELFESGRLVDERLRPAPQVKSGLQKGVRDDLPPMDLHRVSPLRIASIARKWVEAQPRSIPTNSPNELAGAFYLVWESKPLKRRDLNIEYRPGTHLTGSVNLDKGLLPKGVDHRIYFREGVFSGLNWTRRSKTVDEAHAKFQLVLKGINYGEFDLRIRHTTSKEESHRQRNALTRLSWGPAREHIARPDLIDRTLAIYRDEFDPTHFKLEID